MKNKLIFFNLYYLIKFGAYFAASISVCYMIFEHLKDNAILTFKYDILLLSIISSFILGLLLATIHNIYNYVNKVKKFIVDYEHLKFEINEIKKNNDALSKQFLEKQHEIKNLKIILNESNRVIETIENMIKQGLTDITFNEKEYLRNIYEIFRTDTKYLENTKGGYQNEKWF